ncbi:MAG: CDP-diacylglycerol--glycerol-3-phosphate 3-phosphatidyltransferase [Desulfobulbaceae bacterium BRH_c16a]|nr:MAG: CDP-diacylglycerol--glycerol-3-phosphate 3-phosphatidyltransferase [Desulfobulbaceae bacterium BRH_c16a]
MKQLFSVPNLLTGFRFALIPVLIVLFSVKQNTQIEMWSFVIFSIAALTDFVDGWVARRYHIETVLGKLMDPLADKALVTTALIMLIPLGKIVAWVCLVIICREIIVTGFRGLAATTGKVVAAGRVGKLKSNFQYFGLGFLIFPLNVLPIPYQYTIGTVLIYCSLVLALWSGAIYAYRLRGVFLETSC